MYVYIDMYFTDAVHTYLVDDRGVLPNKCGEAETTLPIPVLWRGTNLLGQVVLHTQTSTLLGGKWDCHYGICSRCVLWRELIPSTLFCALHLLHSRIEGGTPGSEFRHDPQQTTFLIKTWLGRLSGSLG
jgi:hypothetical protein